MKNVKVILFLGLSIVAPMAYGMDDSDAPKTLLEYYGKYVDEGSPPANLKNLSADVAHYVLRNGLLCYPGREITRAQFKSVDSRKDVITQEFVNSIYNDLLNDLLDENIGRTEYDDLKKIAAELSPANKKLFEIAYEKYREKEESKLKKNKAAYVSHGGVAPVDSAKKWSRNQKIGLGAGAAVIAAGGLYLGRKGYQKYKKWKREQEKLKREAAESVIEDIEIEEDAE